jgi:hypothetical protein
MINPYCHGMHLCCICLPIIYYFPLLFFLPVDPETATDPEYDYVADDPSFSAELPGK